MAFSHAQNEPRYANLDYSSACLDFDTLAWISLSLEWRNLSLTSRESSKKKNILFQRRNKNTCAVRTDKCHMTVFLSKEKKRIDEVITSSR